MGGKMILLISLFTALAACNSDSPKLPFIPHAAPASSSGPAYHRDPHHQYFDKLRKRYYYYDPDRMAYFWENGQPKR